MPSCLLSQSHNFFCLVSGHFCCKGVKYWTPLNSGIHGSGHNLAAQQYYDMEKTSNIYTHRTPKRMIPGISAPFSHSLKKPQIIKIPETCRHQLSTERYWQGLDDATLI